MPPQHSAAVLVHHLFVPEIDPHTIQASPPRVETCGVSLAFAILTHAIAESQGAMPVHGGLRLTARFRVRANAQWWWFDDERTDAFGCATWCCDACGIDRAAITRWLRQRLVARGDLLEQALRLAYGRPAVQPWHRHEVAA